MENFRFINLANFLLGGTLLVLPLLGFAYDDKTTHPALTKEVVELFNQNYPNLALSDEERRLVMQGSIDEDSGVRWFYHFYDPVYSRGLVFGRTWRSSKDWAKNILAQAKYDPLYESQSFGGVLAPLFGAKTDYSWERAIYEYVWGSKEWALKSLGHVLHLLEDATVPDHTRNDPHPPTLDTSPYEHWAEKFNPSNTSITSGLNDQEPKILSSLSDHFDTLATYSNSNFFSKDTIFSSEYENPKIKLDSLETLNNGRKIIFSYADDGEGNYRLVGKFPRFEWQKTTDAAGEYFVTDPDHKILSDYWSRLSKQAVLHGAGVIKLFFDEVEKEKQAKVLYEKNRSWLAKQVDKFQEAAFQAANVFYGITVTPADVGEEAAVAVPVLAPTGEASPEAAPAPTPAPVPASPVVAAPTPPAPVVATVSEPEPELVTPPPPPPASPAALQFIAGGGNAPTPSGDTSAPPVTFTISQCNQSLSSEGCLVDATTLDLQWSTTATDLKHFSIDCYVRNSQCPGYNFYTTAASTTIFTVPRDNATYTFVVKSLDTAGNEGTATQVVEVASHPLVINEIAWAGTSATRDTHEWIELYNPTTKELDLSGGKLKSGTDSKPNISLSGTLAPGGYYLIERSSDATDVAADLTPPTSSFGNIGSAGAGLSNLGEVLSLEFRGKTIDKTPPVSGCNCWAGGAGNPQYWTMERYDPTASGEDASNWGSWQGFLANGKNADNLQINGTPKKRNGLNYLITKNGSSLMQNKTLTATHSPYLVVSPYTVSLGATLTLDPGVIIKFFNGSSALTIDGILNAFGTALNPVVFTSFKDDSYGGDTNQDGASTTPQFGDWGSIKITGNTSVIDHALIRYGGARDFLGNLWANLRVENATFTLTNSTIEEAGVYGMRLLNASGSISGNTIRSNTQDTDSAGILLFDGNLSITGNTFSGNRVGLDIHTAGGGNNIAVKGNTFTGNTQEAIRVVGAYPSLSGNSATGNGLNGTVLQGTLTQSFALTPDLPYIIQNTTYTVSAGTTLTIYPGTIVKLQGIGAISVSGKLIAEGTPSAKIVFTSLHDDEFGGDTNATSTAPAAGDWHNLSLLSSSAFSSLSHITIRYGGANQPLLYPLGVLRIIDTSADIRDALVEKSYLRGISLENSTATRILDSRIANHQDPVSEESVGLFLAASSTPLIQNTVFENNKTAIKSQDGTSAVINGGGIQFMGNTTNTVPADLIP